MISLNFVFTLVPPKPNHREIIKLQKAWDVFYLLPDIHWEQFFQFLFLDYSEAPQLEELCKSYLLPPQCQDPLNFSLNRCRCAVRELLLAACCTQAIMPCSSIIPGQHKQFQQRDSLNRGKVEHKSHADNDLSKNFSSWKVNSFLLLWTFPYRLQSMWLVYRDAVRKISWKQVSYKPKKNSWNTQHWICPT